MLLNRYRFISFLLVLLESSINIAHGGENDSSLQELRARTLDFRQSITAPLDNTQDTGDKAAPLAARSNQNRYLSVAEYLYRRGDYAQAAEQLQPLIAGRRQAQEPEVIDLYLRIMLARGRSLDAANWLLKQQNASIHTPYIRFNFAVALMRSGRAQEAVTVLYRLGTMTAKDTAALAIRDQANLALGWYFLGRGLGLNAKASFARVRLRSPQANSALLGMGWSELAPQHAQSYREYAGDEASAFGIREYSPTLAVGGTGARLLKPDLGYLSEPFGLPDYGDGKLSPAEKLSLARAIRHWRELQQRDPNDPFVWESWIAMPYALAKAAVYDQAAEQYRLAIGRLQELEAAMDSDPERVSELAQDCLALLQQLPLPGDAGFVLPAQAADPVCQGNWLAANPTQVILEDLAEARRSLTEIENAGVDRMADTDPRKAPAVALRGLWGTYAKDREHAFAQQLSGQIEARQTLLQQYRQSAHFALARLLDRKLSKPDDPQPQALPLPVEPESFWNRLNLFGKD